MLSFDNVSVGDTVKVTKDGTTIEGVVETSLNDPVLKIGPVYITPTVWTLVEHVRGYKDGDVATYVQSGVVYAGVFDAKKGAFMSATARMFNPGNQGIKVHGNINE